jgi:cobalt-precorrin 5A hydrolase
MSAGIAVRGCAPLLTDKWHDPAVIIVTPDLRYAIPVLGGHHGGNEVAKELAGLGIEPVISTATEVMGRPSVEETAKAGGLTIVNRNSTREVNAAILDNDVPVIRVLPPKIIVANSGVSVLVNESPFVIGIGCRLGTTAGEILSAVSSACCETGIPENSVTLYATTMKKFHEAGLHEAIASLSGNLIFLDDETINEQVPESSSRAEMLGLCGVAEPCALALSKTGTLILKKTVYGRVTIAIGK